ncbi:MAG TPA: DUF4835 family protein [Saprospiraceae bacterium]|nr:DUF4835 family protein [Saprospiraceae bacterium]
MRRSIFLLLLLLSGFTLEAQELNCNVRINIQKLQTVDPAVFETLEQSIRDFMNNTSWTQEDFAQGERIDCNILLTVQEELSPTTFKASLAIQSSRPIYNSDYQTALLNHIDQDVQFSYQQYQPLQFSTNTFNDNLSSVLSFYAYIILGLDFDSFALYGGEPYFQTAQDILNTTPQNGQFQGWRSMDGNRNRFWMVENLLSPRVRPYREAMYNYHRYGLDVMAEQPNEGRAVIAQYLDNLQDVYQNYPNSMILQMFLNAKSDEIIEIFKRGTSDEKSKTIRIMSRIDATNANEYRTIR